MVRLRTSIKMDPEDLPLKYCERFFKLHRWDDGTLQQWGVQDRRNQPEMVLRLNGDHDQLGFDIHWESPLKQRVAKNETLELVQNSPFKSMFHHHSPHWNCYFRGNSTVYSVYSTQHEAPKRSRKAFQDFVDDIFLTFFQLVNMSMIFDGCFMYIHIPRIGWTSKPKKTLELTVKPWCPVEKCLEAIHCYISSLETSSHHWNHDFPRKFWTGELGELDPVPPDHLWKARDVQIWRSGEKWSSRDNGDHYYSHHGDGGHCNVVIMISIIDFTTLFTSHNGDVITVVGQKVEDQMGNVWDRYRQWDGKN